MTGTELARIEFKTRFDAVKNYYGWTHRDISKLLRISTRSMTTVRKDPLSGSGDKFMKINALYKGMKV